MSYLALESPLPTGTLVAWLAAFAGCWLIVRCLTGPPARLSRRTELYVLRMLLLATLVVVLLNPVQVSETPGTVERPEVFYLVDSSQSMTLGDPTTRFEDALRAMRSASAAAQSSPVDVKLFRFGQRLLASAAVDDSGESPISSSSGAPPAGLTPAAFATESRVPDRKKDRPKAPLAPTDSDTQLMTALRQISSRFGHQPPAGIVVFSDGRARDETGVADVVSPFKRLGVPVHVLPTGSLGKRGDISIVAVVIPPRVRKYSEVEAQVFIRSFGYDGVRTEVTLTAPAKGDKPARELASLPVTLRSGFQAVSLTFRTTTESHGVVVSITEADQEISDANNQLTSDVSIDRTKIRVLYIEGSAAPLTATVVNNRQVLRGPFTDISTALMSDDDIECVVLSSAQGGRLRRVSDYSYDSTRGFPETKAELAAFDAIILSDIPERILTSTQIDWIEEWVGRRGGGLLMAGGPNSFSAGGWSESKVAALLPVELLPGTDWNSSEQIRWLPLRGSTQHPIWDLYREERRNDEALSNIPPFSGANRFAAVKPNLTITIADGSITGSSPKTPGAAQRPTDGATLQDAFRRLFTTAEPTAASAERGDADKGTSAAVVLGRYGRGRTAAIATAIPPALAGEFTANWKAGDQTNFPRFWRNLVYWLTENSSIGRRRLIASADKKFYSPGDKILISSSAFDELARQTKDYRIVAMIEPGGSLKDAIGDYSPFKWPEGIPRTSGEDGPYIAWGEELEIPLSEAGDAPHYAMTLAIADALDSGAANQSLRLELTAYEDLTQVDSTSLDIQVLHDPFELQNPFPNHDLLRQIADLSGGRVLNGADDLAQILREIPVKVGPPIISRAPLWSRWWLWLWMIGLLTIEWVWRRKIGLA